MSEAAAVRALVEKKVDLERMIKRLKHMDAHTSLFLLQKSIWLPRLQYLLRAAPVYTQMDILTELDHVLRVAVTDLLNVRFDESSWQQAVLPTRLGGLGLRQTADVALPSFISSLHRCRQLLLHILPSSFNPSVSAEVEKAIQEWCKKAVGKEVPKDEVSSQQKPWDSPLAECKRDRLLINCNQFGRARILGAATSESGAWLRALPSSSLGTHLDNHAVRVAVALRVGADVSIRYRCRCGVMADGKGYHALTCRFCAGRLPRHTALNDIIRRALKSAGVPAILEPQGIDRGDGKRPDGLSLYPFSQGRCLVWDATCVNSFASSRVVASSVEAGAAAKEAEKFKCLKYSQLSEQFYFAPVAFETTGACGPSTRSLLRELAAKITSVTGDHREMDWLLQRCSIAIVRGNAASILLGATPDGVDSLAGGDKTDDMSNVPNASQQMPVQPPSSPKKTLLARKVKTPTSLLSQSIRSSAQSADLEKRVEDPLYIGLNNLGNSCYQNAALQSLLGLPPFLNDMISLFSCMRNNHCRTLAAVTKLMLLRQMGLQKSISEYLCHLRAIFAEIDPVFFEKKMQDTSEFLVRLLSAMQTEIETGRLAANPVSDNFQYQTIESYTCIKCSETKIQRHVNISWIVGVPCRKGDESPTLTLQDAFRQSMRPDRRELRCQHCSHDECYVTTKVSQLPRVLMLQLSRHVYLDVSMKIRSNVAIPKILNLEEFVSDNVTRPLEWKTPKSAGEAKAASLLLSAPPATSAQPVMLDTNSTLMMKDLEPKPLDDVADSLQEEKAPDPAAAEQEKPAGSGGGDDQWQYSMKSVSSNSYRLLGVISHYGDSAHSGHYVADVYSIDRGCWFRYDDNSVTRIEEADVPGESHQRDGYVFLYLHEDPCSQVLSAKATYDGSWEGHTRCRKVTATTPDGTHELLPSCD